MGDESDDEDTLRERGKKKWCLRWEWGLNVVLETDIYAPPSEG
jgi:hypothetical protein